MDKKNKEANLFITWLPTIIWMLLIFAMSNQSSIKASYFDPLDFVIKKTAHITEYAILLIFMFRSLTLTWGKKFSIDKMENLSILITQIYAISDEWHQSHIAGRTATIRDMFIDFIGVMLGITILKLINEKKKLIKIKKIVYGSK